MLRAVSDQVTEAGVRLATLGPTTQPSSVTRSPPFVIVLAGLAAVVSATISAARACTELGGKVLTTETPSTE